MRMMRISTNKGFTLIELLVSISVFAVVVTLSISLFNQVLRIQRRTEVLRRANQSLRNMSEFIVKEVRNGKIDYGVSGGTTPKTGYPTNCPQITQTQINNGDSTYVWNNSARNKGLAIVNAAGESECIYYKATEQALYLEKVGLTTPQKLSSGDVTVTRFEVRVSPGKDPYMATGTGLATTQPAVQILLEVRAILPGGDARTISYQTSVSTNVYDIPRN